MGLGVGGLIIESAPGLLIGGTLAGGFIAFFSYRRISRLNQEGTSLKTQLSGMTTKLDEQQKAMEGKLNVDVMDRDACEKLAQTTTLSP